MTRQHYQPPTGEPARYFFSASAADWRGIALQLRRAAAPGSHLHFIAARADASIGGAAPDTDVCRDFDRFDAVTVRYFARLIGADLRETAAMPA